MYDMYPVTWQGTNTNQVHQTGYSERVGELENLYGNTPHYSGDVAVAHTVQLDAEGQE